MIFQWILSAECITRRSCSHHTTLRQIHHAYHNILKNSRKSRQSCINPEVFTESSVHKIFTKSLILCADFDTITLVFGILILGGLNKCPNLYLGKTEVRSLCTGIRQELRFKIAVAVGCFCVHAKRQNSNTPSWRPGLSAVAEAFLLQMLWRRDRLGKEKKEEEA